jgi:hypothetical protein
VSVQPFALPMEMHKLMRCRKITLNTCEKHAYKIALPHSTKQAFQKETTLHDDIPTTFRRPSNAATMVLQRNPGVQDSFGRIEKAPYSVLR